jgi:hypothetical protein
MTDSHSNYLNSAYENLMTIIDKDKVSLSNIIDLCVKTMQFASRLTSLRGSEKKKLVISVFDRYNKEHESPFVLEILPELIDAFVDVDKHKLRINVSKNSCQKFCC